jgi:hypothetical protein
LKEKNTKVKNFENKKETEKYDKIGLLSETS